MNWLSHYYKQERGKGYSAREALRTAKIKIEWDALEEEGLVKLEAEPDDFPDLSFLDDWFETRQDRANRKTILELAEREGVWGTVGSYRLDTDDEWETGDSVWGFVGWDEGQDNCYVADIMAGTIEAYYQRLCAGVPQL